MSGYVVSIKPSARRANGAVGEVVNRSGGRQGFPDREAADEWAAALSDAGDRPVWVRDANPNDAADVDGYLVSRARTPSDEGAPAGEQSELG